MKVNLIMAGSGGQGIQFAGQVLALAAVRQGLQATYNPSYGAERRGGTSFCSVVIADGPIYDPVFERPTVVLALDQRGRRQYAGQLGEEGLLLVNADLAPQAADRERADVVGVPASTLAERVCENGALNLVMLGTYLALSNAVDVETVADVCREKSRKKPHLICLSYTSDAGDE